MPWRTPIGVARDPWTTLVCEVMSQQTRLDVVVPRLESWLARWPSPREMAEATEDEVLAAWAGLGYYSRARNLHRTAQALTESGWPRIAEGLKKLPGIGAYTAAAVASLCFGEQVAMVDGNVIRVLARLHALAGDLRTGVGAKRVGAFAVTWVSRGDAGTVNEATMELGSLVCTPRKPKCVACPLAEVCQAARDGEPERFPTARAKPENVILEADIAVIVHEGRVLLRRAGQDELLKGHWTLPETRMLSSDSLTIPVATGIVRHAITHHRIVWRVVRRDGFPGTAPEAMDWCPVEELGSRLVSSLPRKALAAVGVVAK